MTTKKKEEKEKKIPVPRNSSLREIMTLLKARNKLIYVVTHEERRFLEDFSKNVAEPMDLELWTWSTHQGIMKYGDHNKLEAATGEFEKTDRAPEAFKKIAEMKISEGSRGAVFIMRDLHTVLAQGVPRQIRDLLYRIRRKTILITAPEIGFSAGGTNSGLPLLLDKDTVVVDYQLMNREDLSAFIHHNVEMMTAFAKTRKQDKLKTNYEKEEIEALVRACQGLTEPEIQTALKTSMVECGELDIDRIVKTKEQLVKKSQILEFVAEPVEMKDVGGLDQAKQYFETYKTSFSEAAKAFGVEPPTGVLLTGVPGTGKSLLAKAICRAWGLPGIRLDIGKVMTGLVGGSEGKMREAIKQAEALAPCVTGDTIIHTESHGNITVEELHKKLTLEDSTVSAQIKTKDNLGNKVDAEIHTVIRRKASNKKLLKITTESGRIITVTENHKFLVRTQDGLIWKEAQFLNKNDDLVEQD